MSTQSKKPWPKLKSHDEIDDFVAQADLSDHDWGDLEPARYEFEDKAARITMRMPESQLAAIKDEAAKRGVKYQRFIRELLDRGMQTLR